MKLLNSYAQLVGTSAVGKGTRVCQLLEFLRQTVETPELVRIDRIHNKAVKGQEDIFKEVTASNQLGYHFPKTNIFIMGKWVRSNKSGLYSWTGADYTNTTFGFQYTVEISLKLQEHYNYIQEGYVSMFSGLFHPDEFKKAGSTNKNYFYQSFYYGDDKSDMMDRIVMRSSKECKGDAAWSQKDLAGVFYDRVASLLDLGNISNTLYSYKEDVTCFGYNYLLWLGHADLAAEFVTWSKKFSVLRDFRNEEDNHNKFKKLWEDSRDAALQEAYRMFLIDLDGELHYYKKHGIITAQ